MATSTAGRLDVSRQLQALTVTTGLIDAVSFMGLGRVFTANMTGNVVFLAFALAGVPGLSAPRSFASLVAFLLGALAGGRLVRRWGTRSESPWIRTALSLECALLLLAGLVAVLMGGSDAVIYSVIALTALAMGIRNATVRALAVPDLTTTVLTLTLTGIAADSSLAGGDDPRVLRRVTAVASMFAGALVGALFVKQSLGLPLFVSGAVAGMCALTIRTNAEALQS